MCDTHTEFVCVLVCVRVIVNNREIDRSIYGSIDINSEVDKYREIDREKEKERYRQTSRQKKADTH